MSFTILRFDQRDVALSGNTPYAHAQDEGGRYVLSLDPDRLLYPFRKECGADQPQHARPYPNWESMGLGGHMLGHYLSALAGFWNTTGRSEYLRRAEYVVDALEACQRLHGDGYVGGIPDSDGLFGRLRAGDVRAQSFELDGSWVPLYNLHKTFAGLIDCWTTFGVLSHAGETAGKTVKGLADWWCALSDRMDDEAFARMLQCEYGGMNESLATLYSLTGNKRYLEAAQRFSTDSLFAQLAGGKDVLTGMHANTQIPKVLGYERIAEITGDERYDKAVSTFWDSVVDHRSVSIGAHSVAEHFHPADDFSDMIASRQGVETCNSYNMSKLAERLFLRTGESRYLDFYERVLENHILSTTGCHEHGFVYFTPMRPRHYRVYSAAQKSFWCCVGSGLENHARYGRLIYTVYSGAATSGNTAVGGKTLAVNLFIPSSLQWHDRGIRVTQQYRPGEGSTNEGVITLTATDGGQREIDLFIRRPEWVTDAHYECAAEHAGESMSAGASLTEAHGAPEGYDALHVSWAGTIAIHIRHTIRVRLEPLPDGSPWASVLRGPTVMALPDGFDDLDGLRGDDSRAGHIASGPLKPFADLPVIIRAPEGDTGRDDGTVDVTVATADGAGTAGGGVRGRSRLTLVPFASMEAGRYSIYLPWAGDGDVSSVRSTLERIDLIESSGERNVCDEVRCGEQQTEIDHRYRGSTDSQGYADGRHYRMARPGGWFEYAIKDWERSGSRLEVTILEEDADRRYGLAVAGDALVTRSSRTVADGLVTDSYPVERGSLGVGDDMASTVRVSAIGNADGPRVVSVRLSRV